MQYQLLLDLVMMSQINLMVGEIVPMDMSGIK